MIIIARVVDDDELRENDNEEENEKIPGLDQFDFNLLSVQAGAVSMIIYGYILEYISILQAMEVIKRKYSENNIGEAPDPDITALEAARIEVIAQAILLQISKIQYNNTPLHYRTNNLNAARSANFELLLSDAVEEMGYILNYIGVKHIFDINHNEPNLGI